MYFLPAINEDSSEIEQPPSYDNSRLPHRVVHSLAAIALASQLWQPHLGGAIYILEILWDFHSVIPVIWAIE